MIYTKHKKSYCGLCETDMLICATCGNNCCNAGYGEVDGKPCTDCPEVYRIQDAMWSDPNSVTFEGES